MPPRRKSEPAQTATRFSLMSPYELNRINPPKPKRMIANYTLRESYTADNEANFKQFNEWCLRHSPTASQICKRFGPVHNGILFGSYDISRPTNALNPNRCIPNKAQCVQLELRRNWENKPMIAIMSPQNNDPNDARVTFGWAEAGGSNDYAIDALTELLAGHHVVSGYVLADDSYKVVHNRAQEDILGGKQVRESERMRLLCQTARLEFKVHFAGACPGSLDQQERALAQL
ncbi:hypothetical protein BJ508DRAFT_309425 [Ascobolus immersus RN42]|uniref:Uncharacterized protein n=1 Tax=Ascobolus immersus RN42 TaxID=1160509 RepID=A0A3N4HYC0_ASCIM|nr:hypothetical protein BJ508DRAFT_309425 [Ascobolus immersus RN42]